MKKIIIGGILFFLLFFSSTALATTSFTGNGVITINGEKVLIKGSSVTIRWGYSCSVVPYKCSYRVSLNGSQLISSTSLSGSQTVTLDATGTLSVSMYISYSNHNPDTYSESYQVVQYPFSGSTTWSFSGNTITFSGNGPMADYAYSTKTPWYDLSRKIEHIVLEEGVTSIGDKSFEFMDNLKSVELPSTLLTVGDSSFSFCRGLEEITLPDSVTQIKDGAFGWCDILNRVTLPSNLKTIGRGAFTNCPALEELLIPKGTKNIARNSFSSTPVTLTVFRNSLAYNYVIENNLPYVFYSCPVHSEKLLPAVIPTEIKTGRTYGLYCPVCEETLVEQRTIPTLSDPEVIRTPASLESIGEETFANTGCKVVLVSEACTSIGKNAFENCRNLLYIRIPASVISIDENAFVGCDSYMVIDREAE